MMERCAELSVIIPVYNTEMMLDRCVKSVVSQSYGSLQIILVDDGSTDRSGAICDAWAGSDKRITVIHKENGGLSDARNYGLEIADAEYVTFVDSDDYIEPDMYKEMLGALKKADAEIAVCAIYCDRLDKTYINYASEKTTVFSSEKAMSFLLRGDDIDEAVWNKVYKKSLFEGEKFPVGEINEDVVLQPVLFGKATRVVKLGRPLYHYCENTQGITHAAYNDKKSIIIKHLEEVEDSTLGIWPGLKNSVLIFKGRYALNMLIILEQHPELKKKYFKDYAYYKKCVWDNRRILERCYLKKFFEYAELILALLGIYYPFWKIKKLLMRL